LLARAIAGEIAKALGVKPRKPQQVVPLGAPALLTFDMGDAALHFRVPRNTIAQRTRSTNPNQQDLWNEAYV
jgi:DNA (cytosine-5)-methyltransferase 1